MSRPLPILTDDNIEQVVQDYLNGNKYQYPSISNWDVSRVTDMHGLFAWTPFNQDISNWDVSNVTRMDNMFGNSGFNKDISKWDVRNVKTMAGMFDGAKKFNQPLAAWATKLQSAEDLRGMFADTRRFNQDLSSWDLTHLIGKTTEDGDPALADMFIYNEIIPREYLPKGVKMSYPRNFDEEDSDEENPKKRRLNGGSRRTKRKGRRSHARKHKRKHTKKNRY